MFKKRRLERELDAELRFHLDQQIKDNIAAGMSPEEARRCAVLEFGGLDRAKEGCRDQRSFAWFEQMIQDVRYASRQLLRAPSFAVTAILTVALGIGACTTIFSLVNGVLLKPLRFPQSEQIVFLTETRPPNQERIPLAPAAYLDWVAQTSVFEHLAAFRPRSFNSAADDQAINLSGQQITANYFSVLGVKPILGRNFLPEEEIAGKNHVAILSHWAWQKHYGGREDVINQTVLLDDQPHVIIGVLPKENLIWNPAVFVPTTFSAADRSDYGSHGWACIGRLKTGTSAQQARADLGVVCEQIAKAHPSSNLGRGAYVSLLLQEMTGNVRSQLLLFLGAVGFVLLIACVNVASLLLARANTRQREIAVRAALGASRGRIVRQFLCESSLIAGAGGILGALIAFGSMSVAAHFAKTYLPRTDEISVDGNVLAWTIGLMLASGFAVGLLPALQFTRGDMADALKDSGRNASHGRRRQRARSVLVVAEIALAMMLLAGTGLLARSLYALQRADQGFKAEGVYITGISLGGKKYNSAEKRVTFVEQAIEKIAAANGVQTTAFTSGLPFVSAEGLLFTVFGTPEVPTKDMPKTYAYAVTPTYFEAMSIPLIRGCGFTAQDVAGAPRVVIINQELARRHFAGVDPVGQRLMIMTMSDQPDVLREIVGVAGDIRTDGPQSVVIPQVYEPFAQRPHPSPTLVVRMKVGEGKAALKVSEIIRALDRDLPFHNLHDYRSSIASSWSRQQFSMVVFILFSGIALLLAAIGIYGVMAYSVNQRIQEIGIRMALGADARAVVRLVCSHGARMVGLGLLIGAAGALAFARLLQSLLFDTSPTDPLTLVAVALILAFVAFLACWGPARRATKVNPVVALRSE